MVRDNYVSISLKCNKEGIVSTVSLSTHLFGNITLYYFTTFYVLSYFLCTPISVETL